MSAEWLMRPAPEAARTVAQRLLAEAAEARTRLGNPEGEPEALHDFRVALRRLRSWIRAFRPQLDDTLRGRARRRLSRIADATGGGRDLEVLVELLARLRPRTVAERAAQAELRRRLLAREHEAEASIEEAVEQFDDARKDVEAGLSAWMKPVVAIASPPVPLAAVMAARLQEQAAALAQALAEAREPEHQSEAHAARIAGKRVRYLLEPLASEDARAKRCVKRLKALQDVLGDMHDAHVLELEAADLASEAGAPAGAAPLAARIARRVRALHLQLRREWFAGGLEELLAAIAAVEQDLLVRAGQGLEHERKFLLRTMPPRALRGRRSVLEQGWIPGSRIVERVRRERTSRATRYWRTIKAGKGVSRIEAEEPATERVFRALWPLTAGKRVRKERFVVTAGGLAWEIDRFLDRDLVLAEVELASADAVVVLPPWLAPHVVREVTGEDAYVNLNLAR